MRKASRAAAAVARKPTRLDLRRDSAAVMLLGSSSRNLDLDFWAKVILSENPHVRMSVTEMRERIIARIEDAIVRGDAPDARACASLGVPSFADLVNANADEFCSDIVRKVRGSAA